MKSEEEKRRAEEDGGNERGRLWEHRNKQTKLYEEKVDS